MKEITGRGEETNYWKWRSMYIIMKINYTYFLSVELGLRSLSMIPRVKLLASFSCLCSEGFVFPTSGSHTITSSFVVTIGGGSKKFAPDSYTSKSFIYRRNNHVLTMLIAWPMDVKKQ